MRNGFLKDNRGMTMTEVLLAFVILSIIMGLLSGIIAFSKKMYVDAADLRHSQEDVNREIYKKSFRNVEPDELDAKDIPVYRISSSGESYKKDLIVDKYFAIGMKQKRVTVGGDADGISFLVFVSSNEVSSNEAHSGD